MVLRISSDGDERRTFFGSESFDSGIFLGRKIWQVFFWGGWLDLSGDFWGYPYFFVLYHLILSGNF